MWRRLAGALLRRVVGFDPLERPTHEELPEPFRAEVLLDGVVVGRLTERRVTDMFWRSYRIEPIGRAIDDDALWDHCRFTFRDPATGRVCTTGFVGGIRPFVQDGRVSLRALYFERVPRRDLPRARARTRR